MEKDKIIGPIVLITIGLLFLLQNFGVIPWNIWRDLWHFWPIILILSGLQILTQSSRIARSLFIILVPTVVIAIVFYAVFFKNAGSIRLEKLPLSDQVFNIERNYTDRSLPTSSQKITSSQYPVTEVGERLLNFNVEVSELTLKDNINANDYLSLTSPTVSQGNETLTSEISNRTLKIDFSTNSKKDFFAPGVSNAIILGQTQIPTDLNLHVGAGSANLDLKSLQIKTLNTKVGVGSCHIDLSSSATPTGPINLNVGVGTIKLKLPQDIGLKINYRVGLGTLNILGQSLHQSGTYQSNNYDQADKKLTITAEVGLGSIEIISQ